MAGKYIADRHLVKSLRRLANALLITLLGAAMFAAMSPGLAHAEGTEITVDPSSGLPGSEVTIKGTGFSEWSYPEFPVTITITIDGRYLADTPTGGVGDFSVSVPVPMLPPGAHKLTATDSYGLSSSALFTVLAPEITVAPSGGLPGSKVTITGTGFYPDYMITITIDGQYLGSTTPTSVGPFSPISVVVPMLPPGDYTLNAANLLEQFALAPFTIQAPPDLTISSTDYWFENDRRLLVLSVEITNQGDVPASGTQVDVWDQDSSLPVGTRPVPALSHGETTAVEVRLEIPEEWRRTTRTFLVEVAPIIGEVNEVNNRGAIEALVLEPRGGPPLPWIVPPVIVVAAGVGLLIRRWLTRPKKIDIRPHNDDASIQHIESDTTICLDHEIRLRPVLDPGEQHIEREGSPNIDGRSEEA